MTKESKQKKIAAIHDLSGYGRCSLTVAMPVISALKVQCCPVPTSILSNHTVFQPAFSMITPIRCLCIWNSGKN